MDMLIEVNITDIEACILAIEDGNAEVAKDILDEIRESFIEEQRA